MTTPEQSMDLAARIVARWYRRYLEDERAEAEQALVEAAEARKAKRATRTSKAKETP